MADLCSLLCFVTFCSYHILCNAQPRWGVVVTWRHKYNVNICILQEYLTHYSVVLKMLTVFFSLLPPKTTRTHILHMYTDISSCHFSYVNFLIICHTKTNWWKWFEWLLNYARKWKIRVTQSQACEIHVQLFFCLSQPNENMPQIFVLFINEKKIRLGKEINARFFHRKIIFTIRLNTIMPILKRNI